MAVKMKEPPSPQTSANVVKECRQQVIIHYSLRLLKGRTYIEAFPLGSNGKKRAKKPAKIQYVSNDNAYAKKVSPAPIINAPLMYTGTAVDKFA
jgi:hypothetical protein